MDPPRGVVTLGCNAGKLPHYGIASKAMQLWEPITENKSSYKSHGVYTTEIDQSSSPAMYVGVGNANPSKILHMETLYSKGKSKYSNSYNAADVSNI